MEFDLRFAKTYNSCTFPRVRYLCWLRSSTRLLLLLLSALCCYILLVVTWPTTHTWTPLVYAPFVTPAFSTHHPPIPLVLSILLLLFRHSLFSFSGTRKFPPPFSTPFSVCLCCSFLILIPLFLDLLFCSVWSYCFTHYFYFDKYPPLIPLIPLTPWIG